MNTGEGPRQLPQPPWRAGGSKLGSQEILLSRPCRLILGARRRGVGEEEV